MEKSNDASLDAKLAPQDFVGDLSFAARALVSQPAVAMVTVLLWCLPTLAAALPIQALHRNPLGLFVINFGVFLLWLGWAGAERIFFLRRLENHPVTLGELSELGTSFFGRFLALSLLAGIAFRSSWCRC